MATIDVRIEIQHDQMNLKIYDLGEGSTTILPPRKNRAVPPFWKGGIGQPRKGGGPAMDRGPLAPTRRGPVGLPMPGSIGLSPKISRAYRGGTGALGAGATKQIPRWWDPASCGIRFCAARRTSAWCYRWLLRNYEKRVKDVKDVDRHCERRYINA